MGDYANRLGDLAQILDERIDDGNPKLIELIEDAIAQAEDALGQIDDSNGEVMPVIMQLREVHERACTCLGPDPVALAERLFRFQTTGDWDTFHSVLPGYERALGESGLARYRQLVEAAWKKLPALGPKDFRTHFDSDRYRVEHAMEELTALSGDIDGLVTVKSRNLSSPHAFLEVAELLQRHGRHDDALKWAENGIAAFPDERLDDLVKFCIAENLRRGDAGRVESLAWQRFLRQPGSEAYFELVGVAKRIGRADGLAAKALDQCGNWFAPRKLRERSDSPAGNLLFAAPWSPFTCVRKMPRKCGRRFAAVRSTCGCGTKSRPVRGKTHPDEAVTLYKKLLPHVVNAGTRGAQYGAAFEIVKAIQELRAAQSQDAVFKQELAELRLAWKAKRNFMKLLATFD